MRTIHKFQFELQDYITIEMPMGSEVLTVQVQNGIPCIWAIVDTSEPMDESYFVLFGTGHPLPNIFEHKHYIGSFQLNGFVGHLFSSCKFEEHE